MLTTWQEALDFLYERPNWEVAPPKVERGFKLDRVERLLAELGDPHLAWPAVHIGGTNGKGSTSAMVAAALRQGGYRVGLFTSPHMHTVRERIQVDGRPIEELVVIDWLNDFGQVLARHPGTTTFEALSVLAFHHFAAEAVDVAVIEVGLGGRLDTTNVIRPVVSALTSIGLDHTEILGDTLALIAADKAGIFRPGVPALTAPQAPEALEVIEAEALAVGTPLAVLGRDVTWTEGEATETGQRFTVSLLEPTRFGVLAWSAGQADATLDLEIHLSGAHQRVNAALAVAVLATLAGKGWRMEPATVAAGLAAARWPGRFEVLSDASGRVLVLDGAHNPPAAAALAQALQERFPGRPRRLILGIGKTKDAAGILAPLLPGAIAVVATRSEHPKALAPDAVAELVREEARELPVTVVPLAHDALAAAWDEAAPGDVVVATGSIFLVADIREAWAEANGLPLPPRDPELPDR